MSMRNWCKGRMEVKYKMQKGRETGRKCTKAEVKRARKKHSKRKKEQWKRRKENGG